MAYTRIHAVKATIDKSIAYICNPDKTEGNTLVSSFSCSPETAAFDFNTALSRTSRKDPNLAYHLIQSFAPGEVSDEEAHRIGIELAEKLLKGNHSYVIATHNDRMHTHNHIIFCAADNIDHRKFNSCRRSYYRIRNLSDELCREHGLSVIVPEKTRSKSYPEWRASRSVVAVAKRPRTHQQDILKRTNANGKLIDTSVDRFKNNPGLDHWASIRNLQIAARSYADGESLSDLKNDLDRKSTKEKAAKKELAGLEHRISELKELKHYLEQYRDNLPYHRKYKSARDPERYFRNHEAQILLFDGARRKLAQIGVIPRMSALLQIDSDLKELVSRQAELKTIYRSAAKERKDLERKYRNVTEYLGMDLKVDRNQDNDRKNTGRKKLDAPE